MVRQLDRKGHETRSPADLWRSSRNGGGIGSPAYAGGWPVYSPFLVKPWDSRAFELTARSPWSQYRSPPITARLLSRPAIALAPTWGLRTWGRLPKTLPRAT